MSMMIFFTSHTKYIAIKILWLLSIDINKQIFLNLLTFAFNFNGIILKAHKVKKI